MATIIWQPKTGYKLGTVVQLDTKYYIVHQVDVTGTSNGADPRVSTWYWKPAVAPVESTPTTVTAATMWSAGINYALGTVVSRNGKYYKVYQVDATGTSSGSDPEVSAWYWQLAVAPTVAPTSTALPLPKRVVATYFKLWSGTSRITSVPLHYNQIYLFHSQPVSSGTGAFSFNYSAAVTAAEIDECQKRGQRVVLTIGGENAGFNFSTRAQSNAFIASFKTMNDLLGGVDGCDFNNFEAFIGSSATEMVYIGKALKAFYGQNFSITCPPGPDKNWAPMDFVLVKAMADAEVLDYAGPQFYDSSFLTSTEAIVRMTKDWITNIGAEKVVIGLSANYAAGPTLTTCMTAWNQLELSHPGLRGVFAWSTQDDAKASYKWGSSMAPLVKS